MEELIIHYAGEVGQFRISDLRLYMQSRQQNVPVASLYLYLNRLIEQKKLIRKERGVYSAAIIKPLFYATVTNEMKEIYSSLHSALPFADFCLYIGSDLSQFQHNISCNKVLYVETEKDTCDSAFNILKEASKTVYVNPGLDMINRYVDLSESAVIIKSLTSESPVHKLDTEMTTPTLEKLLVDINADDDFFYLQEEEAFYIFRNASERFIINTAKLLRYARRRNQETLMKKYIEEVGL